MNITEEDRQKIIKWIQAKASPGLRCFVCGDGKMAIDSVAAMTVSIDVHTGRIDYMNGYPMIPLICPNCAHTIWFNTNIMGLKPE